MNPTEAFSYKSYSITITYTLLDIDEQFKFLSCEQFQDMTEFYGTLAGCRAGDQMYRCPPNLARNPYLKTFGEKCYQFNNYEISWYAARDTCSSRGGMLVQIRTAQIQQFLMESLRSLGWNRNGVWMGAHDLDDEGHWKWVEGNLKGNHNIVVFLFI